MKVSFDFDGTLDNPDVQDLAKCLVEKGFEVWIVTSRDIDERSFKGWNNDLYSVADSVGIKRSNIKFTPYEDKYVFLDKNDFLFHIDDDFDELNDIMVFTNVIPINVSYTNKLYCFIKQIEIGNNKQ